MKKVTIFFKIGETKTESSGKKLGWSKNFQIFSNAVGKKLDIRERNWAEAKIFDFFSKTVILKRLVRERNLIGTQWR